MSDTFRDNLVLDIVATEKSRHDAVNRGSHYTIDTVQQVRRDILRLYDATAPDRERTARALAFVDEMVRLAHTRCETCEHSVISSEPGCKCDTGECDTGAGGVLPGVRQPNGSQAQQPQRQRVPGL